MLIGRAIVKEFDEFWIDTKSEAIHAKPDQKLNIHTHGSNLILS